MTALAGDRKGGAIPLNQRRYAQSGTRPEDNLYSPGAQGRGTQTPRLRGGESGQRPGDRLEIIDDAKFRKTEAAGELAAPEPPGPIGQGNLLALDRSGHCEGRSLGVLTRVL